MRPARPVAVAVGKESCDDDHQHGETDHQARRQAEEPERSGRGVPAAGRLALRAGGLTSPGSGCAHAAQFLGERDLSRGAKLRASSVPLRRNASPGPGSRLANGSNDGADHGLSYSRDRHRQSGGRMRFARLAPLSCRKAWAAEMVMAEPRAFGLDDRSDAVLRGQTRRRVVM